MPARQDTILKSHDFAFACLYSKSLPNIMWTKIKKQRQCQVVIL